MEACSNSLELEKFLRAQLETKDNKKTCIETAVGHQVHLNIVNNKYEYVEFYFLGCKAM
jgi:hypothetical protein